MSDKEKGSDARLPREAEQHMKDQLAADDYRLAAEQERVDAKTPLEDAGETSGIARPRES